MMWRNSESHFQDFKTELESGESDQRAGCNFKIVLEKHKLCKLWQKFIFFGNYIRVWLKQKVETWDVYTDVVFISSLFLKPSTNAVGYCSYWYFKIPFFPLKLYKSLREKSQPKKRQPTKTITDLPKSSSEEKIVDSWQVKEHLISRLKPRWRKSEADKM